MLLLFLTNFPACQRLYSWTIRYFFYENNHNVFSLCIYILINAIENVIDIPIALKYRTKCMLRFNNFTLNDLYLLPSFRTDIIRRLVLSNGLSQIFISFIALIIQVCLRANYLSHQVLMLQIA